MVEMTAPNGATTLAADEAVEGLKAMGFAPVARPEPKPEPRRRAPRKREKPQDK